ncbi:MAG: hypothetical protein JWP12_840 [Bacteroidetes bacterium]|nr:hypothetical protein [Bacteroidota bacterium]
MTTHTFFQIFLMLHLVGFVLFAGATIINFVTLRQFWQQYELEGIKAKTILQSFSKLPVLGRIGMAAIILSGVGMMAMTRGVFGEQIWFRIKFGFVIVIILNALLVGRRLGLNLRKLMEENKEEITVKINKVKSNLRMFHTAQLVLFFIILLLSVFKFN